MVTELISPAAKEAETTRRVRIANVIGQGRYELRVLTEVLADASKPINNRDLLKEVRKIVKNEKRDGAVPPYNITMPLLRATLGIMVDLGAVEKKQKDWDLTSRGREVIGMLSNHQNVRR